MNLAYVYDENGNVDSITDGTPAGRQTRAMGYDALDRLTSVTSPMFTAANYGYDVLDNLTTVQVTGGNQPRNHTYVYTSQRLTQIKQTVGGAVVSTLAYDVRGNVSSKGTATFDFDQGNRLRGYAATASYTYDGYGRRVLDTVSGVGSRYSYCSRDGKIVYNNDDRVGRKSSYIYFGGALVTTSELVGGTTTIKYQHADLQGTPLVVTNAAKATLEVSEYEPYGRLANRAMLDQVGYTGHVHDGTGGLTYMQQRYYDPQIGRFLSVDPVAADSNTGGNSNRYWYANNNPYKFTDPDGRAAMIAVDGDNVRVVIPMHFYGNAATPENIERIVSSTVSTFSGSFDVGGKAMNVTVGFMLNDGDAGYGEYQNSVELRAGPTDHVAAQGASYIRGGKSGQIDMTSRGQPTESAHEMGHVMGAGDHYQPGLDMNGMRMSTPESGCENNLMGTLNRPIDGRVIEEILESPRNLLINSGVD